MPVTRRDTFQAIADPNRRAIINLIAYGSLNLNDIANNFKISRSAVSQHVKILAQCGLIRIKKVGRERFCQAHLEQLDEVSKWVEQYRKSWEKRFDKMDILLLNLKKKNQ
jgi:DNA-binding transcriptional ArsR family regulator